MMQKIVLQSVIAVFFLGTSAITVAEDKAKPESLIGTEWAAEDVVGTDAATNADSVIRFEEGGKIEGTAGCNTYTADAAIDGDSITISNMSATDYFCEYKLETDGGKTFIETLGKAATFSVFGETMRVKDKDGKEIIVFALLRRG